MTAFQQRLRRRHRNERTLRGLGLAALGIAALMLTVLVGSLASTGWRAFTQTHIRMEFAVSPERVKPEAIGAGNYRGAVQDAMVAALPDLPVPEARNLAAMLSNAAQFRLRDAVLADPSLIGRSVTLTVPVSDPYDQLHKGLIDRDTPEENRRLKRCRDCRLR